MRMIDVAAAPTKLHQLHKRPSVKSI